VLLRPPPSVAGGSATAEMFNPSLSVLRIGFAWNMAVVV
jgi:hypothetical protein